MARILSERYMPENMLIATATAANYQDRCMSERYMPENMLIAR
jgi:hypothetical protein